VRPATGKENAVQQRVRAVHDSTDNTNSSFSNVGSHVNCLMGDTPDVEQRDLQPTGFKGHEAAFLVAFE
jgi:hypothetical protein